MENKIMKNTYLFYEIQHEKITIGLMAFIGLGIAFKTTGSTKPEFGLMIDPFNEEKYNSKIKELDGFLNKFCLDEEFMYFIKHTLFEFLFEVKDLNKNFNDAPEFLKEYSEKFNLNIVGMGQIANCVEVDGEIKSLSIM